MSTNPLGPVNSSSNVNPSGDGEFFFPISYGSYEERRSKISPETKRDLYFPECTATTTFSQIGHFIQKYTQGTFLEVYDKHLSQVTGKDESPTFTNKRVAEARALVNLTGKMILGTSLVGAGVLTIAFGIVGLVMGFAGSIATKGELDPAAGAYVGAAMGCLFAGTLCCMGAFAGSCLIALTEPETSSWDKLKIVGLGTGTAFVISMYAASPILSLGKNISEIRYLQENNVRGFLFLHCFGVPT